MKKRIIAIIAAVVVVVGGIVGFNYFGNGADGRDAFVYAGTFRDGIMVTPTEVDATGIGVDSAFVITFEEGSELSLDEMTKIFNLAPALGFEVSEDEGDIHVTPTESFDKNTLVKLMIGNTSWVFQTQADFSLIGSLPRNESTNVPTNSGIELYFSHPGAQVSDYFEIEPKVKGSFEVHGSTVVFVPKALEPQTVYTVTLNEGLGIKGADRTLSEKMSFSFETGFDKEGEYVEPNGYFNFYRTVNDFSTSDPIYIPMNFSINDSKVDSKTIETKVYRYKSTGAMAEALADYMDFPAWRNYYDDAQISETKGLDKVIEFEQEIEDIYAYEGTIDVPVELDAGTYLVQSQWEDIAFQTFVQVTDLSYYYFTDDERAYYWVNDLSTDGAAVGTVAVGIKEAAADEHGLLTVPMASTDGFETTILRHEDQEILHYTYVGPIYYRGYENGDNYWKYLQTDRNLYKPTDDVHLFGFLKNRETGASPAEVTVKIGQQRWYYDWMWPGLASEVPLVSETVQVKNGFYEGMLSLPNLEQGNYQIEITSGEDTLATHYIQVENYVKPDYKLSVSADKKAIFFNESVVFSTKTSFFEGTPVAGLQVNYDVYGISNDQGEDTTNEQGEISVIYEPGYSNGYQDEVYAGYSTYATLPESGELYGNANVRVFVNDIHVSVMTEKYEDVGNINVEVNKITLDRINEGTAEGSSDYLDAPVEGQKLTGVIYRNERIKEPIGDYYDFINKVTRTRYNYYTDTKPFSEVTLVTDSKGIASVAVDLPRETDVYYTMKIKTMDGNGHPMTYDRYFGEMRFEYRMDEEYLRLEADKERYHVGEPMEIQMKKGDLQAEGLRFMYIFGSGGLESIVWSDQPLIEAEFSEKYLPNVVVEGLVFTGDGYERAGRLDASVIKEDYKIDLTIETDRASYKPGDRVKVHLTAVDKDGIPVTDGQVNISIVDEALFALSDQNIDTLERLYGNISSGLSGYNGSHNNGNRDRISPMARGFGGMDEPMAMEMEMAKGDSAMTLTMSDDKSEESQSIAVRKEFEDTALFLNVILDDNGKGSLTFKLPDNVTSWRLTAAALSTSLKAGSQLEEVVVTLPFFINTNMNRTYLIGDKPYVGVSGYGNDLTEGESIRYTVICEENGYSMSDTGVAYERVNLPLFELEEGTYKIKVLAETESGMTDGYEETIEVIRTYQEKRVTDSYDAAIGFTMSTSDFGMTTLTFTDRSRGMYVPDLYRLMYSGGKRVDQRYIGYLAGELLEDSFGVDRPVEEVKLSDYMSPDGGIGILPYSDADLETSVKMSGLSDLGTESNRLKSYLYTKYYGGSMNEKSMALYGLTLMGEPVLNELNQWQMVENLTSKDQLWLALSYAAIGDTYMAELIYEDHLLTYMETFEGMARYVESDNKDEQYEMTAKILPLLAVVDEDLSRDAFAFVNSGYSKTYLANLDIFQYITRMFEAASTTEPQLTYTYDGNDYEADFNNGYGDSVTLPSAMLDAFEVKNVASDIVIVADYNDIGNRTGKQDEKVSISRHYENYNTGEEKRNFIEGDIVKVVIDWRIASDAIDHGYTVTDYAPSGLVPIKNIWHFGIDEGYYWYRDIEDQKVTFGVYKDPVNYRPMVYYARVVSPGTFTSDIAMIQGNRVLDSYNLSDGDIIVIKP